MAETGYQIRMATLDDIEQIKKNIRRTMSNPEGRAQRKQYAEAIARQELMVLIHFDPKQPSEIVEAFLEWHVKVDGAVTIRDAGSVGDELQVGYIRLLLREMLRTYNPVSASAKIRVDLAEWNSIFEGLPGCVLEGREFSRPYWRAIWTWTQATERAAARPPMMGRRRR